MLNNLKLNKLTNEQLIAIAIIVGVVLYFVFLNKKKLSSPVIAPVSLKENNIKLDEYNNDDDNVDENNDIIIDKIYNVNESFTQETVTLYYAKWCPHCKNIKPLWEEFKNRTGPNLTVRIVEVSDFDKEPEHVKNLIKGFPTVLRSSDNKTFVGPNAIQNLINVLDEEYNSQDVNMQENQNNMVMILCYSNQCPHCHTIMPKWLDFKQSVMDNNLPIYIREFESNELPEDLKEKIPGFPTVILNNEPVVGADQISNMLDKYQNNSKKFTLYYSNNCGYCVKLLPTWHNFVNQNSSKFNIVSIEQENMKNHNVKHEITAFPTLIVEENGTLNSYIGQISIEDIIKPLIRM